jgi:hypothetical protein
MAWGDEDPVLKKAPAAAPTTAWGNADPSLGQAPPKGARKTSQSLGFDKGFGRPVDNLAHWLDSGAKAIGVPMDDVERFFGEKTDAENRAAHEAEFRRRELTERPGKIGETIGGMVGTGPVLAVTKNPWIAGGAQGALNTEHPDDAGAVALDAGVGAGLNKAGGVAVEKAGQLLRPVIDPAVKLLRDAGVRLTPGQVRGGKAMVREDKAMSRPRVGEQIAADRAQSIADFSRGGINRALMPLGVRLPDHVQTGHDAIAFMQDAVKTAYDKITPNLKLAPDKRLVVGMRNAAEVAKVLPEREADIFTKTLQAKLNWDNGNQMTGRPLAVALRDIRKAASGYSRSASEAERQLGEALSHVDDAIHSSLGVQNPGYAKALKATNLAYRGDRIMSDAAKGADEGIASTGQVKSSVRQNDRSKNQRKTAAGRAYMQDYAEAGRKVLPSKTPDSGTAGRSESDKIIPNVRGAVDLARYKADKAYSDFLMAPRPAWAKKLGGFLEDYRREGGLVASGLFAGMRRDE